jgi:hypothetical protein
VQRTHTYIVGLIALGFVLAIAGCENSFDPRGPYQKQLVVYSILSNTSDSQYVRVYTTYNPAGFNPDDVTADTYVRKAVVTLVDDSATYRLRDTSVTRIDKSRYSDDIGAYIAYPCRARVGKNYRLSVASDQGTVSGTVSIPDAGQLIPNNPFILKAPDKYGSEDITVTVRLSTLTRGFVVRLYLDYLVRESGAWVHKRDEIPTSVLAASGTTIQYNYPKLIRRISDVSQPWVTAHFPMTVYSAFFSAIVNKYGTDGYKMVTATYMLTQVETNLYKYYNLANGFQDEFSIRTDQPDFSNIQGGFGVFGAMTLDSVRVDL